MMMCKDLEDWIWAAGKKHWPEIEYLMVSLAKQALTAVGMHFYMLKFMNIYNILFNFEICYFNTVSVS